ncbi:MAG TPA: 50S ribosomal protein L5 [Spirochaetota bacterium]|nr:50S ribosomal protein L5 [Spirochaetota bacterium]HPY02434.1 50S ribosomal protein L5 [Spirochaetota bacterium]HQA51522.1 50S ribosomal protein L5 [Spirochaetota bacterium]HQO21823.1 50S ribosomal protein L5 [Spirochaetota bacterium]
MAARLYKTYNDSIKDKLKKQFNYSSAMQIPKIEKVVLNVGVGDGHSNTAKMNAVYAEMTAIAGQKPVKTVAKKAVANFKIREGYELGCKVTLRGDRMYEFLDRLINFSLPRVRDFKGISGKSFDNFGNYNFSIKEQIIFPEIDFDKAENIYGINVTVVTNAKTKEESKALLESFGMPFRD